MSRSIEALHRSMPWEFWLLCALAIALLILAHVVAVMLVRYRHRLTAADAVRATETQGRNGFRNLERYLSRTKLTLLVPILILLGIVVALPIMDPQAGSLARLMVVFGVGVLGPVYLALSLLQKAFGAVADRIDQLSGDRHSKAGAI